jgi:hypothetical protein
MAYARYRHLVIAHPKPPPDELQLRRIETLLGARLPDSFKEYLAAANGGYLEYVIDVETGQGRTEPLSFCGLFSANESGSDGETLIGAIRLGREVSKIPKGVLPFARDGGGSIVYLDLSPSGNGRVVAFVHGLPEWAGRRTKDALVELAPSFDEYVEKLRVDRDSVIDHLTHDMEDSIQLEAMQQYLQLAMPGWRDDSEVCGALNDARRRLTSSSGGP